MGVGVGVGVGEGVAVAVPVAVAVGVGVFVGVGVGVCPSFDGRAVVVGVALRTGVGVPPAGFGVFSPATVDVAEGASFPANGVGVGVWPGASWAANTSFCPSNTSTPAPLAPWSWLSSCGRRDESDCPGGGGVATEPSGAYCMQPAESIASTASMPAKVRWIHARRVLLFMKEAYRWSRRQEYRADSHSLAGNPVAVGEKP